MNRLLEWLLASAMIGSALAFGGVQPIAYSLVEVGIFLALGLLLVKQTRMGRVHLPLPVWPVLLALFVAFQLVPLPAWLVGMLSPQRLSAPEVAGFLESNSTGVSLSIYPHDTALALVKFLAYLGAFVLAASLYNSGKRKSTLIGSLIFLCSFEACYGIVQYLTGWQKIFTYTKIYNLADATGTYINRNHFAGLLELTLPFVIASAFYSYQVWLERRGRFTSRRGSDRGLSAAYRSIFYFFLTAIIVVALIFSRSRMGILATAFTLLFMAVLAQVRIRQRIWARAVFLFLLTVVSYGMWIGLEPVLARFEQMEAADYLEMEGRLTMWRDGMRLIGDYPVTGTGLGTFMVGFRRFQTGMVDKYVDHAHNDYVQFAAETGLPGAALLFLPVFFLLAKMIRSFLSDPMRYRRSVTLGCIGATLALLLHSITDFNLQIPTNALIFAVVLGIGYKTSCIEPREEEPSGVPIPAVQSRGKY